MWTEQKIEVVPDDEMQADVAEMVGERLFAPIFKNEFGSPKDFGMYLAEVMQDFAGEETPRLFVDFLRFRLSVFVPMVRFEFREENTEQGDLIIRARRVLHVNQNTVVFGGEHAFKADHDIRLKLHSEMQPFCEVMAGRRAEAVANPEAFWLLAAEAFHVFLMMIDQQTQDLGWVSSFFLSYMEHLLGAPSVIQLVKS